MSLFLGYTTLVIGTGGQKIIFFINSHPCESVIIADILKITVKIFHWEENQKCHAL